MTRGLFRKGRNVSDSWARAPTYRRRQSWPCLSCSPSAGGQLADYEVGPTAPGGV